jgi:hypothetical protein
MAKVARNFECEFTGSFCENAKCKRGFCELERKEKTAFAQLHADEDLAIRERAKMVARSVLELNGVKRPSDDEILSASKRPLIIEEAKRQEASHRAFLRDLIKGMKRREL